MFTSTVVVLALKEMVGVVLAGLTVMVTSLLFTLSTVAVILAVFCAVRLAAGLTVREYPVVVEFEVTASPVTVQFTVFPVIGLSSEPVTVAVTVVPIPPDVRVVVAALMDTDLTVTGV